MSLRCGCYDQADDLVFGPLHTCTTYPALSSRTAPPLSEGGVVVNLKPAQYDGDPDDWTELRPYERVLGEDETHD